MNWKPTKKQQTKLDNLIKHLGITTQAEKMVLEHIFFRDIHRNILVWQYKTIKENNSYVYNGSKYDLINELKSRKSDKAIHIDIFASDLKYIVFIYDNKLIKHNEKFIKHVDAINFTNDFIQNKIKKLEYDYLTLSNVCQLGNHQFEIIGNYPIAELSKTEF